jgi:hypothetical protein
MRLAPVIMLVLFLLATGCKKKAVIPVTPPVAFTTDQYFPPLKVGNYWAYQRVDTAYNRTYADTIRVVSDSIINSMTYYNVTGGIFEGITDGYYCDSAGTVIMRPDSYAYGISNKANDTLSYYTESIDTFIVRTGNVDTLVNVVAGAFSSIQIITDVYYPGAAVRPVHKYLYFGKGVGVIYATTFFENNANDVSTAQLVGYHITP